MRTFHNEKGSFSHTVESVVLIALVFTMASAGIQRTLNTANRIRSDTLRLHVIANSDEDFDQELKLKVRDRVLSETGELFAEVSGKS
ncbi:MAG: stage II sporulation protein R, partial [Clostridia bacterium]|nr:stage II sporulation protein R [Clostridia bacterium]